MHASPSSPSVDARGTAPAPRRLVVDAPTRMFHWLFALSFAGAWLTADSERWRLMHVTLGYAFAGLLAFRLLYGLAGPRHARLAGLWRRLSGGAAWLRALPAARSRSAVDWRQGQNLAMALLIVAMMALVAPLALSGWVTYQEWGSDWLEDVHEFFGNALLTLALTHLGLIALLSVLRRRNLALPMLTGRIDGSGPSPVKHNRVWLAAALLLALLAFGAWQWQSAPLDQGCPVGSRDK
jgi:cytochrome b